jgi:transcriptional/translational regulatory protein YebC/TACO1
MGTNGSLEFIFDRKGVFTIDPDNVSIEIEELEMELIDGGLEELEVDEEAVTIYCEYADFNNMQTKLEELDIEIKNSELQRIPNNFKTISAEQAEKVLKLLDLLEENDDVQQVFHNMELTEEILTAMDSE